MYVDLVLATVTVSPMPNTRHLASYLLSLLVRARRESLGMRLQDTLACPIIVSVYEWRRPSLALLPLP